MMVPKRSKYLMSRIRRKLSSVRIFFSLKFKSLRSVFVPCQLRICKEDGSNPPHVLPGKNYLW